MNLRLHLRPDMEPNDSNGRSPRSKRPDQREQVAARRYAHARTLAQRARAAILIDGSNLYNELKENLRRPRLNAAELIQQLLRDPPAVRPHHYHAMLTHHYAEELRDGQARFFES